MVTEFNSRGGGSNSINGATRQPRAATQGGHIFGGQMGRGHAYANHQMGSQLTKIAMNQQKFAQGTFHDNSLSNGYLMTNASHSHHGGHYHGAASHGSHGSPKYSNKTKYFSNQPPLMNMKFPTTSHGNRSSTNHNAQYTHPHHNFNPNTMQNVLGNIQKHI